jgi:hypothetical protein
MRAAAGAAVCPPALRSRRGGALRYFYPAYIGRTLNVNRYSRFSLLVSRAKIRADPLGRIKDTP